MPKYLTPLQYRLYDQGVITPDVTDLVLAQFIMNAEVDIDAFCGFTMQHGGFEQHRVWSQSAWDEGTLRTRIPTFPVPVQQVYGYKIQVSNQSTAGAGFFALINSGDVAISVFDGYVEIVPLQAVTYSLSPVILQLGLKPALVQFEYQAGFLFPVFGEILMNKGDNLTYYASRGFWMTSYSQALSIQPLQLPPIPPVVYLNGVVQASGFTLNTTDGIVTFASSTNGAAVTLDYTYSIPDNVKQAAIARTNWLLGQRALNRMGLSGLDQVQGDREQRVRRFQHTSSALDSLIDPDTANKLLPYRTIAVA